MVILRFLWTPAAGIDAQKFTLYQDSTPTQEQDIMYSATTDRHETQPVEPGHEYLAEIKSMQGAVKSEPLHIPRIVPATQPAVPPPTNGSVEVIWQ